MARLRKNMRGPNPANAASPVTRAYAEARLALAYGRSWEFIHLLRGARELAANARTSERTNVGPSGERRET
jgi:hypothetical protein